MKHEESLSGFRGSIQPTAKISINLPTLQRERKKLNLHKSTISYIFAASF